MQEEDGIFEIGEEDIAAIEADMVSDNEDAYAPLDYTVSGEIVRIVFNSTDANYSVVRLKDADDKLITLVGCLPNVMEGQEIEATGRWELHKEHGRQLRVSSFHTVLPNSPEGIKRFLASGVLPGIGDTYAQRIVDYFGADTIHILDACSERLKEVPGIGAKRVREIRKAWKSTTAERETRIFLQGIGLTPSQCIRVISKYGVGSAAEMVQRHPYRLAYEIDGFGFLRADSIAAKLGIENENEQRLAAGVVYALDELVSLGHTCCPSEILCMEAEKLLNVSPDSARKGLNIALGEGRIVREEAMENGEKVELLFTRRLLTAERDLAHSIRVLLSVPVSSEIVPVQALGDGYMRLNVSQRQAVDYAFKYGFSIITGGPGVGKTTVINQITAAVRYLRMKVLLAAPTGRAAKRLSEATGRDAQTIHRLLKWDVEEKKFVFNQDRPLTCDMLVVDEVSMLDTQLAASLFAAVEPGTRVVLVGDKDQLPSVGPGAVLHDLIASGKIPVTYLTEVYRQADGSRIITNAHNVNNGIMPDLSPIPKGVKADFYWIEQDDPVKAGDLIARMVTERIPSAFGFNPITDVQVLSPMRKGECGTIALNEILQKALNPPDNSKATFQFGTRTFRVGDKVMQTSNNYDKGVFNGEVGIITMVDNDAKRFTVLFDIGGVEYQQNEADQLQLAYAVTVHKSQGSEYPVVLIPVLSQHFVMLQKNLIYTGMTRAKKLLIMVGTRRALNIAVHNDKPSRRRTMLVQRLRV